MFPMLPSLLAAALVLCSVEASSFPQQNFSNKTKVSSTGTRATGNANQCFYNAQSVPTILWSQMEVTATITAATVLLVANNRTNSTKTSTISNTRIDPNEYAPATINKEGTVTTSVVLQAGSTNSTRYIAYPTTRYEEYPSTYSLCGTLNTTISGSATRLTYQDGCDVYHGKTTINNQAPTFTYPSHPPPSETIDSDLDLVRDPKGWTYSAVIDYGCCGDTIASAHFPDLGVWACTRIEALAFAAGPSAKSTVTIMTATSTSTSTEASVPSPSSTRNVKQDPVAVVAVSTGQASHLPPPPLTTQVASPIVHETLFSEHDFQPSTATENTGPSAKVETTMAGFVDTVDHAEISTLSVPVQGSITDNQGRVIAASRLSTLPASAEATLLVPISATYIDAQRNAIVSTNLATIIPVPISSTNERGEVTVSPSLAIAPVTVSTPVVLTSTNAQGRIITSTSYLPPLLLTTSDARSFQLVTTSPLLPAVDIANTKVQESPFLTTSKLPPTVTAPPAPTIGSQTITANSQNQYIIGSQTLTSGGRIIVSGTTISPFPSVKGVISGTSTETLNSGPFSGVISPPAIMIGSQTITADSLGQYVVGSQTLTPGGVITIAGTRIPLSLLDKMISPLPSGTGLMLGTSTEKLISGPLPDITSPPAIVIGSQTATADSLGQYVFGSQILTPGGVVTIAGTPISLVPGGTEALVGSSTEVLGPEIKGDQSGKGSYGNANGPEITSPPAITIGTQTITADSVGQYIFGSQTLTPGGVVTIAGTTVSLAPDGSEAIVVSSTEGLGQYIIGGLGGREGYGNASAMLAFSGAATQWGGRSLVVMGLAVVMVL